MKISEVRELSNNELKEKLYSLKEQNIVVLTSLDTKEKLHLVHTLTSENTVYKL